MADVLVEIKQQLVESGEAGWQITDQDMLARFAKRARLCFHRGLLCEVPPPASRSKTEVGDGIELIIRDGELFVINVPKFREKEREEN